MFLPLNKNKRSDLIFYYNNKVFVVKFLYNLRRFSKYKFTPKKEIIFLDYYKWGGFEAEALELSYDINETFRKMNSFILDSKIEEVVMCYAFMPKNYGVVSENDFDTKQDGDDVQGIKIIITPKGFMKYINQNYSGGLDKSQIKILKRQIRKHLI